MSLLAPLRNPVFARLFGAQVVALAGTGLLTIALALLAYDLAGDRGGFVVGIALTIKMVAYVTIAPVAAALLASLPRRAVLVSLDLVRAGAALALPFVTEVWQIYVLIFLLQSASAAFTPAFQATIPEILKEERDYTQALSLSRLAYDLENLASPVLATALLAVMSSSSLFVGTAAGFVASAALVTCANPPSIANPPAGSAWERTTLGTRIYLATPRLRGLLALNLAAAAGGAMVIVNTAVIVQAGLGRGETDVGIAMACFGAASMLAALLLPRTLERVADRTVMLAAGAGLCASLLAGAIAFAIAGLSWTGLLAGLGIAGFCYSAILTPSGRLLRRSSTEASRPSVFAAQFALSHACWLLSYPMAGVVGATFGMALALAALGLVAAIGFATAVLVWPAADPDVLEHEHCGLPSSHPHLRNAVPTSQGWRHAHPFVIDEDHRRWPA